MLENFEADIQTEKKSQPTLKNYEFFQVQF